MRPSTDLSLSRREIADELDALPDDIQFDYDSQHYWWGCLRRRLLLMRCEACGYWIHFPRRTCPRCWDRRVSPCDVRGRGFLYTYVVDSPAAERSLLGVVELVEQPGLRITAPILSPQPDLVEIGMALRLTWTEYRGVPVPAFERAADGGRTSPTGRGI